MNDKRLFVFRHCRWLVVSMGWVDRPEPVLNVLGDYEDEADAYRHLARLPAAATAVDDAFVMQA